MDIHELLNRAGQEEPEEGAPGWMCTFADMSNLLLTFFVLLLSFANTDAQKFREMLGSVQDAFGVQKETWGDYMEKSTEAIDFSIQNRQGREESEKRQSPMSMDQALSIVQALFEGMEAQVEVLKDEAGVTVRVDGKLLFTTGSAELKPQAASVLNPISGLLEKYTFDLYILGHTDSVPIETRVYPSNWELSGARAAAALRYLSQRGADPQRLVAVGFADSRPIAPNNTPEGRARNRRVEFLFKDPEFLPSGGLKPARP
jgi:chemotaxis protein MotB